MILAQALSRFGKARVAKSRIEQRFASRDIAR
jgi:hypothetical protein